MFTIDLLNGQGIPPKTKPAGIVTVAVTAALPVVLALGTFRHNKVILSLKQSEIVKVEADVDQFADAMEERQALMKEKINYGSSLSEVGSSLKNYIQWSPILTTVVENMPESIILTSLEVDRIAVKKKVPKKDNPKKTEEIEVPTRLLRLSVRGAPQSNCDEAVRDFQDRLRTSATLEPRIENIRVSWNSQKIKGQDVFFYEITCVFKPEF